MINSSEALQYMAAVLNELQSENARYKAALEQIEAATIEKWTTYDQALGHTEKVIKTIGNMPAIARVALRRDQP